MNEEWIKIWIEALAYFKSLFQDLPEKEEKP
jgi:hypothetical protein